MSEQTNKRTRAGDKKASKRDRNKNKRPFQRNVNDFENYLCLKIGSLIAKLREKKICTKRLIKKQYIDQTVKICLRDKMEKKKWTEPTAFFYFQTVFFSVATVSAIKKKRITRKNCCYFIKINSSKSNDRRRQQEQRKEISFQTRKTAIFFFQKTNYRFFILFWCFDGCSCCWKGSTIACSEWVCQYK